MAVRPAKKALVVLAGAARTGDRRALAVAQSLTELGVEAMYLGAEDDAQRIAALVVDQRADAVELCLSRGAGVVLLRDLLRELMAVGRRDVSIVVHRVE